MPLFDRFLIVDWSGAGQPVKGKNSVWACLVQREHDQCVVGWIENFATRHAFMERLDAVISDSLALGERLLCGFDFAFGYPQGAAERLTGQADWRALWRKIAAEVEDAPDNRNNRFAIASAWNAAYFAGEPRFWGRPHQHAYPDLSDRKPPVPSTAPGPFRHSERYASGAKSVWQLAYNGSVGSQTLLGIARLSRYLDTSRHGDHIAVWPFTTGFSAAQDRPVVFAEIYPSLFPLPDDGMVKDAAQVRTVARAFADFDRDGRLATLFARPPMLRDDEVDVAVAEEGWVLGIGHRNLAAARSAITPEPAARRSQGNDARLAARPIVPVDAASAPVTAAATTDHGDCVLLDRLDDGKATKGDRARGTPGRSGADPLEYLRDPAQIYRQSFATIRAEVDLDRFPAGLQPLVIRLIHACGMVDLAEDIRFSLGAAEAGVAALMAGAPVLCDAEMVRHGIIRRLLPADNPVVCHLNDVRVRPLAAWNKTTRSAAQVDLWLPQLEGAVVAIGNAPTALFRLLELLDKGAPKPAIILGFPVGFVGAAESKAALAADSRGTEYVTVAGRRGGSAMASAAVNALAGGLGAND